MTLRRAVPMAALLAAGLFIPAPRIAPIQQGAQVAFDVRGAHDDLTTGSLPSPTEDAQTSPAAKARPDAAAALAAALVEDGASTPGKPRDAAAYAPDAPPVKSPALDAITRAIARFAPRLDPIGEASPLALDADRLRAAVEAYRKGDLIAGDRLADSFADPDYRLAIDWAAIRLQPLKAGSARLSAFLEAHPDWPSSRWIKRRIEAALFAEKRGPDEVRAAMAGREPETTLGALALARADLAQGREGAAAERLRRVWRAEPLSPSLEQALAREFGGLLTPADWKARADLLFYADKDAAALAAAKLAGPDAVKLAQARAGVGAKRFAALVSALPPELRDDPTLAFAQAERLRKSGDVAGAAALLVAAPNTAAELIDGDAWSALRQDVARKLLDKGDGAGAYKVASGGGAQTPRRRIEAATLAGWIALRHLSGSAQDAAVARAHFDSALALATTPGSRAKAAYWRARANEKLGETGAARADFALAAQSPANFFGQLAAERLGRTRPDLAQVAPAGVTPDYARAFRTLYEADEKALALPLALDAARAGGREGELASLVDWLARRGQARSATLIGKAALNAGGRMIAAAFPTYGVPAYQPAPNSVDAAVVLSVARQESLFQPDAVSRAGAKGLMQMLESTARETAKRAGLPFDRARLINDPAFNAQLGAAHLGALLASQKGSYILTFAAYNAGPGRVRQWLQAYGDPREAGVDPIDWIERIPFSETRDYVRKILENLQIYRMRLGERDRLAIDADLKGAR